MTANNSISLAQFDYAVKFEEEYREAIASGGLPTVSQFSQVRVVGQGSKNFFSVYSIFTSSVQLFRALLGYLILQIYNQYFKFDMMCGLEQDVILKYVAALTFEL